MGILEDMTIDEVRSFEPEVVAVPIGSTEPHGPHLPYCTDSINARATAESATMLANAQGVRVLCYPTLPISLNVNFSGFPFALSLRVETFMQMLTDICEQIENQGVRRIVIVNGHGGNTDVIAAFLRSWAYRGVAGTKGAAERAFICSPHWYSAKAEELVEHWSNHAGETEVLEMTVNKPELIRQDKFDDFQTQQPVIKALGRKNISWVTPWHLYLPRAACGKTQKADPQKAAKFAEYNAAGLAELLAELAKTPWSDTFPYEKKT